MLRIDVAHLLLRGHWLEECGTRLATGVIGIPIELGAPHEARGERHDCAACVEALGKGMSRG